MPQAIRSHALAAYHVVHGVIDQALAAQGFGPSLGRGHWVRELAAGIEHTVAVPADMASDARPLAVTVTLGVRFRPLAEQLKTHHRGTDLAHLAKFTCNVGQLSARGGWREWTILDEADAPGIAARVAKALVRVGLPWLDAFQTPQDVHRGLKEHGHPDYSRIAAPIIETLIARDRQEAESEETAESRLELDFTLTHPDALVWHCDE